MSAERRQIALRLGLEHEALRDRQRGPAASTARFAPCTASGGCAAIVAASAVDLGVEIGVVDEPLAQADAVRLVGVDARRGPDQLLRLARADDARQPLRAAEVGQDAVLVLEQPDLTYRARTRGCRTRAPAAIPRRARSRAPRRSSGSALRRATSTPPACAGCRRRSGRRGACPTSSPPSIASVDPPVNTVVSMPDENARPLPITTTRAQLGVVAQLLAERAHLVPHRDRERVELVGAVEPQPADGAVARELDGLVRSHASTVLARSGRRAPARPPSRSGRPRPDRATRRR